MKHEEIEKLIRTAECWVGYHEKASCNYATYEWMDGNAGGANFTRFGRIADLVMQGEDKRNKDGFPWCAMFLISCLYESKVGRVDTTKPHIEANRDGIEFVRDVLGGNYFPLKHMAGVANIYKAGVYLHRIDSSPHPGDFVIYINDDGRPYHIGLVVMKKGSQIVTIEGNTSGRVANIVANGGVVARNTRMITKKTLFFKNSIL